MEDTTTRLPEFITTGAAAKQARVSVVTAREWADRHGLGRKFGGRYRIDPAKWQAFLEQGAPERGPDNSPTPAAA